MRVDWPTFVIKPSTIISALCYSIFRLEPYGSCSFSCAYCYARWYRSPDATYGKLLVRLWRRLVEQLSKVSVPPPFFRLSTLADPFQDAEEKLKLSLSIMQAALNGGVPLVINTKSTLLRRSLWFDVLLKLADEGVVLVQISLTTLNETLASKLEPRAPSPTARLEIMEALAEHGVPVVARVQPLIPGIEEGQVEAARAALEHRCKGVIVEPLRETAEGLARIALILGYHPDEYLRTYGWEPYSLQSRTEDLLRPGPQWRWRILDRLKDEISSKGIVTVCKDGLWPGFAHHGRDCCQAWHMAAFYSLRKTVFENLLEPQPPPPNVHLLDEVEYGLFPRPLRRGLRLHHNKLKKVVESEILLAKVVGTTPSGSNGTIQAFSG